MGNSAKTDSLDARALAFYGYERYEKLELFRPQSKRALDLSELASRRNDLKQLLVAEKNRLQGPRAQLIKDSCAKMIKTISEQIESITKEIDDIIERDEILRAKKVTLQSIPGIGRIIMVPKNWTTKVE